MHFPITRSSIPSSFFEEKSNVVKLIYII
jgi:hypothetical protein